MTHPVKPETSLRAFYGLVVVTVCTLYACLFFVVGALFAATLAIAATGDHRDAPVWVMTVVAMVGSCVASWRTQPSLQRWYEATLERIKRAEEGSDR